jgi:hypothetical protein
MSDAPVIGDVSVTHPAADTYVVATAREAGAAAAWRGRERCRKYDTHSKAQDYDFAPFVMGTYRRLGRPAMAGLNDLAEVAAANCRVSKAGCVRCALRELAVALYRGNALMHRVSLSQLVRTAGRGYRPGLLVLIAHVDRD